jgi:hypothetical protein
VSIRLGTSPHVILPHDWHTCSAIGGMPFRLPSCSSSTPRELPAAVARSGWPGPGAA